MKCNDEVGKWNVTKTWELTRFAVIIKDVIFMADTAKGSRNAETKVFTTMSPEQTHVCNRKGHTRLSWEHWQEGKMLFVNICLYLVPDVLNNDKQLHQKNILTGG